MIFQEKLDSITEKNNSLVSVGLDSDIEKLPVHLRSVENPLFNFNKAIIDSTHDLVCVYKLNSAFYEAEGDKGISQLKMTCEYINSKYADIPVIIDAKRGDIGNTNQGYAKYVFDYLQADAITVMPYMGIETLKAFFNYTGKGIIIGCHSSNPGAREFQELEINNKPLYVLVAEEIIKQHGTNPNCMIFMGATFPEELKKIRTVVGDMTLLVPGVGTQEGGVEKTVKFGLNSKKSGIIINSSRSIIYASNGNNFAEKAREQTQILRQSINGYRD